MTFETQNDMFKIHLGQSLNRAQMLQNVPETILLII